MGYTHGKKYNEDEVKKEILKISKIYGRMPSNSEMIKQTGNHSLCNKISRSYGFYGWAKKLNLKTKESETKKGFYYEGKAKEILESLGYKVSLTSLRAPYDLVVGDVRIDVKCAIKYYNENCEVTSFGINKKYPVADIYMMLAIDEFSDIERIIIIPSAIFKNKSTISIGKKSKYDKHINNYKLIDQFQSFYDSLKK